MQVFDGTPAAREGTLQSGDELLGVNGVSCKGKTKVAVAKMIQATDAAVQIAYNKLHADPVQGETLDIALKKIKHRLVEGMSTTTADTLGLSRAILCNDSLVKRLQELQGTESMYRGLVEHAKRMLKAYFDVLQTYQAFGGCFAALSVREPQPRASEAFRLFGELHRNLDRDGVKMLKAIKPVLADLGTYLTKAIPDTKLTIRRYADAKFAYLSYCLKVKEMDDEEHGYAVMQEPTYRVETGNYEYRLVLRCRQEARTKFAGLRSDVLEKMELLESKHARDLTGQLRRFVQGLAQLGSEAIERLNQHPHLFPVEVDLKDSAFQYKSTARLQSADVQQPASSSSSNDRQIVDGCEELAQEMREIPIRSAGDEVAKLIATWDSGLTDGESTEADRAPATTDSADLLVELGLDDIDLSIGCTFDRQATGNQFETVSLLD